MVWPTLYIIMWIFNYINFLIRIMFYLNWIHSQINNFKKIVIHIILQFCFMMPTILLHHDYAWDTNKFLFVYNHLTLRFKIKCARDDINKIKLY